MNKTIIIDKTQMYDVEDDRFDFSNDRNPGPHDVGTIARTPTMLNFFISIFGYCSKKLSEHIHFLRTHRHSNSILSSVDFFGSNANINLKTEERKKENREKTL